MTWQKVSSVVKYQNRYMQVTEDQLVTDHGDKVTFGIVRKEPFSVVIPFDGEKILLVGQYRPSAEIFSWEFPMGHAEENSPLVCAQKELSEETGLLAKDLIELGTFYPAIGTMNQKGYLYLTTSWDIGERHLDTSEKGMQLKWVTLSEFIEMVKNGDIFDGPTITAFKYLELYLAKK